MRLKELAGPEEIHAVVKELASRINRDYAGKSPVIVCVLKGSFIFMADLVRLLEVSARVEFIKASSYGTGTASSGSVKIDLDLDCDIAGLDVILVDDILDTGLTLNHIIGHIMQKRPGTLKLCVLLDKPARRRVELSADYIGMEVEDKFLVGYGLDLNGEYRGLNGIFELVQE